jgi:hypothetical protein
MIGLTEFQCPSCRRKYEANFYDERPSSIRYEFRCAFCKAIVVAWSGSRQYANFWPMADAHIRRLRDAGKRWPLEALRVGEPSVGQRYPAKARLAAMTPVHPR